MSPYRVKAHDVQPTPQTAPSAEDDDVTTLSWKQRYRDISPVTLQLGGGAVSASLYCDLIDGLRGLAESFLVEIYRCKLCQFTCEMKTTISSHLLLRHHPPSLTSLACMNGAEEARLQQASLTYPLDLAESKQSEEEEDFLLYNMLDNMSPPTCDVISTEGELQVAHNCEVSPLFEEDESIFPLKRTSGEHPRSTDPPATQEEMAQSAHLMTLGLCRITATRTPLPPVPIQRRPVDDLDQLPWKDARKDVKRRHLSCSLCLVKLPSRRLLDAHVKCHQSSSAITCCIKTADRWTELKPDWRKRHRRREEEKKEDCSNVKALPEDDNADERKCLIGPSDSRKKKGTHIERDSSATPKEESSGFICSLCQRKFSSKVTLQRHLGVHSGDKPFSCPQCSYRSRLKDSLLQHMRTHTGEKPYKCVQCPYASIDRSSLLRHSRTHSQEKPYRCQHCDYRSIQKKSLDLHARRHHTGEMFPCQQCEYSSPDRQLLLRHTRRRHAPSQRTSSKATTQSCWTTKMELSHKKYKKS
ncbi:zinc finger imprinted 3 [Dunckerocampus dactyliophorus]|uniref:zinc finger imprinted 3 n=1 Tax=Dunckerocampus dactyliophorus TaxID=161453 RepID=UPI002404F163|nr:zinc finger imprinted 3 [Dunckerocampus dactyliophorus]